MQRATRRALSGVHHLSSSQRRRKFVVPAQAGTQCLLSMLGRSAPETTLGSRLRGNDANPKQLHGAVPENVAKLRQFPRNWQKRRRCPTSACCSSTTLWNFLVILD